MDALKHKYGPLPGYAWGGIAVVAIVLLAKLHGGSSSSSTTNPGGAALVPNASGLDGGGGGGGGGDPTGGLGTIIEAPISTVDPGDGSTGGSTGSVVQVTAAAAPVPTSDGAFTPAPAPAPGQSVDSLSEQGVQITPGTIVTAPNPGAGTGDTSSGIAGLGGAAGGQFVPIAPADAPLAHATNGRMIAS
jgi:hypothetical protein